MKYSKNTSETLVTPTGAFAAKRLAVGAASVVAACALVGVGAQGAFAAGSDGGASGSGSANASATSTATAGPHGATVSGEASATSSDRAGISLGSVTSDLGPAFAGHLSGAKAQTLAKKVVADSALFSLLPSSLQTDVTTLKNATVHERTADARKIVSTALAGGYGTAIQQLATHLKADNGRTAKSVVRDLVGEVKSGETTALGAAGAKIAASITGDAELAAKLPSSLTGDLSTLASAPATAQTADVQKIVTTALNGGYGDDVKQVAAQVEQEILSGR